MDSAGKEQEVEHGTHQHLGKVHIHEQRGKMRKEFRKKAAADYQQDGRDHSNDHNANGRRQLQHPQVDVREKRSQYDQHRKGVIQFHKHTQLTIPDLVQGTGVINAAKVAFGWLR